MCTQRTNPMVIACQGQIPEYSEQYNPSLQDKWLNTVAMYIAVNGSIPPKEWEHNPSLKNSDGWTVAMFLALNGIIPPKQWYHDPSYENKYGCTVAMFLAKRGTIPPIEWTHYSLLTTLRSKQTVGLLLALAGVVPPQQWMHDINIKNQSKQTIKSSLQLYNYIYKNNQFILNVQTIKKSARCCVCYQTIEQEFVKSKCDHDVCLDCYKVLIRNNRDECPECNEQDWLVPKDQEAYYQLLSKYQ